MHRTVYYKWLVSFNKLECNARVYLSTHCIIQEFAEGLWIVEVKHNFVIFHLFLNLWVTLLSIVNNDDIFLGCLINLDANLKHPSVVDDHYEFFEQLLPYYGFLLNLIAPRNRYLFMWIAPVLRLRKLKHYRHIVHVGPGSETVALVLHVYECFEWAEAEGELIEVALVDMLHEVEFVGVVLEGAAELEREVVI